MREEARAFCLLPSAYCLLLTAFCLLLNGRLREPVLPAGRNPVGDTAKCPGRFDSEPGLSVGKNWTAD